MANTTDCETRILGHLTVSVTLNKRLTISFTIKIEIQ